MKKILVLILMVAFILPFSAYAKKSKVRTYKKAKAFLIKGDVKIKKAKSTKWKILKMNTIIKKNDKIKVAKDSYIKLKFKDKSILVVRGEKKFQLQKLASQMVLKRDKKKLLKKLKGGKESSEFGATAVAGVRGNKVGDVLNKDDNIFWEK